MCSVSAVMDYGRMTWPNVVTPGWTWTEPVKPNIPPAEERDAIRKFMELVEKAKEFDKAADQPHCEDPEKIKLLERIEQRLERIERMLGVKADALD